MSYLDGRKTMLCGSACTEVQLKHLGSKCLQNKNGLFLVSVRQLNIYDFAGTQASSFLE